MSPVPERAMFCVPPLSEMAMEAVRVPVADGVKVILIVHADPAGIPIPHVFVWTKSVGFVPVKEKLEIASAPLPESLRVTVCVGLAVPITCAPKVTLEVERLTTGAVPVPLTD